MVIDEELGDDDPVYPFDDWQDGLALDIEFPYLDYPEEQEDDE